MTECPRSVTVASSVCAYRCCHSNGMSARSIPLNQRLRPKVDSRPGRPSLFQAISLPLRHLLLRNGCSPRTDSPDTQTSRFLFFVAELLAWPDWLQPHSQPLPAVPIPPHSSHRLQFDAVHLHQARRSRPLRLPSIDTDGRHDRRGCGAGLVPNRLMWYQVDGRRAAIGSPVR